MKLTKTNIFLTSLFLSFIFCLSFLLPSYANVKNSVETRNINVDAMDTLTYKDKLNNFINSFDSYEVKAEDNVVVLNSSITAKLSDFTGIEFLSGLSDTNLTKTHSTTFDAETGLFTVVTSYYQNEELIQEDKIVTTPFYVLEDDDYYIELEDGTLISISETLETSNYEPCSVIALSTGAAYAAILLATMVIVAQPQIVQSITYVAQQVVQLISSIFSWLVKLVTKVVQVAVTVTTLKYSVKIGTEAYTLVSTIAATALVAGKYYITVADPIDGKVYFSTVGVNAEIAMAVLAAGKLVASVNNSATMLLLSIYTPLETDARNVALEASTITGEYGVTRHTYHNVKANGTLKTGVFFEHYHPSPWEDIPKPTTGNKSVTPHAFFGAPKEYWPSINTSMMV